jgi:hypothetical protein
MIKPAVRKKNCKLTTKLLLKLPRDKNCNSKNI